VTESEPHALPPAKKNEKHETRPASWGPAAAIIVTAVGMIMGQVFAGVFVTLLSAMRGAGVADVEMWLRSTSVQFLLVALSALFTVLILALFMRWRRLPWRKLGFERGPLWRDLGLALLAIPVYFGALMVVAGLAGAFLGVDLDQEQEIGFTQVAGTAGLLMAFVSLVVLPPLVEEVLFRGFLFTGLRTKLNFAVAAVITSILFAIPHLFASSEGLLWIAAIDTFVLSLVLCYLREKTGALWAPIVLHALKNGAAFTFLFILA
jgi:membrane protease YdiL (CAAX protease family)